MKLHEALQKINGMEEILFLIEMDSSGESVIKDGNRAFYQLIDLPEAEVINKNINKIFHGNTLTNLNRKLTELLNHDPIIYEEEHLQNENTQVLEITLLKIPPGDAFPFHVLGKARSISKQELVEESLLESNERFQAIFENAGIGMALVNTEGQILECNSSLSNLLGYEKSEMRHRFITDFTDPEDQEENMLLFDDLVHQKKASIQLTKRYLHKCGKDIWVRVTNSLICNTSNEPLYAIKMVEDLTKQKKVEDALKESESRYRTLVENSNAGVYMLQNNRIIYANPTFCHLLGYSLLELQMIPFIDLVLPDDQAMVNRIISLSLKGELPTARYDIRFQTKEGDLLHIEAHGSRMIYLGHPAVIGTIIDLTEKKKTENALIASESRYRTIFENAEIGVALVEKSGMMIDFNSALVRILGYTHDELKALTFSDFTNFEDTQKEQELFTQLFEGKMESYQLEKQYIRKNGQVIWGKLTASRFLDLHSNKWLSLRLLENITERKQAEESVKQLNKDLQRQTVELTAINKELEAFSYSVSHDLRAPLRGIDGFSQALLEDYEHCLDDIGKDYLHRIRSATQRMSKLIDDLLTLSRLSRTEMTIFPVSLTAIAMQIIHELKQTAPNRNADFIVKPKINGEGDPRLLRIVLQNLLDNAWKFTSRNEYTVIEFGIKEFDDEVVYFIRDNGAGFDMTYADKLFGTFQRLHSMEEFPGTGIGLATVQRIIHRHEGRVWAEGVVGKGATFYFTLGGQKNKPEGEKMGDEQ